MNMKETTYNLNSGEIDEDLCSASPITSVCYDGSVVRADTPDVFLANLFAYEFVTVSSFV